MHGPDSGSRAADVVAVFDSQADVDQAVLRLRLEGVGDDRLGVFSLRSARATANLIDRHHGFTGAVVGGLVGVALGAALAPLLNKWSAAERDVTDLFGLSTALTVIGALLVGLIGWGIGLGVGRRGVAAPAVDPAAGGLVLAVAAGDAATRDRAWAAIRHNGGREPRPAPAPPSAV
jgi:hypothetical protein